MCKPDVEGFVGRSLISTHPEIQGKKMGHLYSQQRNFSKTWMFSESSVEETEESF